jgi:hypothetical protein
MDSTLCKNDGQCVDEITNEKGFKCLCSIEYHGEYCEKRKKILFWLINKRKNDLGVELVDTTTSKIDTSTEDLLRFANRLK